MTSDKQLGVRPTSVQATSNKLDKQLIMGYYRDMNYKEITGSL